jgi:hypothetical protein
VAVAAPSNTMVIEAPSVSALIKRASRIGLTSASPGYPAHVGQLCLSCCLFSTSR